MIPRLTLVLFFSAALQAQQSPTPAEQMGQRLRQIYEHNDYKSDPNKQAERASYYEQLLKQPLNLKDRTTVALELANEQLRIGDSSASIATLLSLQQQLTSAKAPVPQQISEQLHRELAIAYLRLGEQQNCLVPRTMPSQSISSQPMSSETMPTHPATACLYPLQKSAVHQLKQGAQGAVAEYTWLLHHNPNSYLYRWLLNVAYQQLGRYPQDVPSQWLIPESLSSSEYDIGYFPDVAMLAGIDLSTRSGGVLVEDFDGDGLLDIMLSSSGPLDQMHFFHNNGDGTFSDRTRQAGLTGELGGLNIVLTDYNNDGHPDVLVLRGAWWGKYGEYPLSLLRNNGNGTFSDVTEAAGLLAATAHPTQTAAWADYDNDGWLDLLVGHESKPDDPHPSQLFHNNHDGTFSLVAQTDTGDLHADLGFVKGVAWGDYNRDNRPDLYISAMNGRSYLFRNDGPQDPAHPDPLHWRFTDVTEKAGLGGSRNTFPTWFFDYDNDGWLDIFAAGYSSSSMEDVGAFQAGQPNRASLPHLYHNNHDGTFTDVAHQLHLDRAILAMGGNFGDLDNDGWLDIYLGTGEPSYEALLPNRMFRNNAARSFQDVTTSGDLGNLQHGHSIAFADIENTGNEDIFEEMGGAYPGDIYMDSLYHNPGHSNHWITLVLEGKQSNRAAYGAVIDLTVRDSARQRHIYRTVGSVSSFGGNPMRQHIGIGQATSIQSIEVHWPTTGKTDRLTNIPADHNYHLLEGSNKLNPIQWKSYEIGKSKLPHQH